MSASLLLARGVVAGYRPDLPIIKGIDAHVDGGEVVTIIGPNGAGKSTFVKAIAGQVRVSAGEVLFEADTITGMATHQLVRAGVGYVPQTDNVFASLTIHENLRIGAHSLPGNNQSRFEQAYQTFPDLHEVRNKKARTLSGGQRQMLAMARALLAEPRLLLLDEPTAGLAPRVVEQVFARIRALAGAGVAILMVEQNARAALAVSDRAYVLAEGRNRIEGRAAALLHDQEVAGAFLGARTVQ